MTHLFSPFEALAGKLLPQATDGNDGSHDIAHLHRVWKNAAKIQAAEGGDLEILCAAVLLHDCVSVEKNDPRRAQASRLAAEKAAVLLRALDWPADRLHRQLMRLKRTVSPLALRLKRLWPKFCRMPTASTRLA